MHIKTVKYRELFSTGNYTNKTVGVTVEISQGEDPKEALERAKRWVESHKPGEVTDFQYKRAKEIADNPDKYMYGEVERARITVAAYDSQTQEIPF
jgi:hypothetical protein